MKYLRWLAFICFIIPSSCSPRFPITVTILDGDQVHMVITNERIPAKLLTQAGLILGPADSILLNGVTAALDQPLPSSSSFTVQIRREENLTINSKSTLSSASTVGEALTIYGVQLYANDKIDPPFDTPILGTTKISYIPSQELNVSAEGKKITIRSSTQTIDLTLAQAGFPLLELDTTLPNANDPLPQDGQIRVIRVSESIVFSQKSIPYESQTIDSPELPLGQQQVLTSGATGLSVSRTRIRYEDGKEVNRFQNAGSIVRPPQTRIIAAGTKIVVNSTSANGVNLQYWRMIKMYATSYSPCRSGVPGQCFNGTKSGLPLQKGVIAVDPSTYNYLVGQKVFIPGYGYAVVGDIGGGYIIEKELGIPRELWIDLGYSDSDYQEAPGWVNVYFLTPAPATIPAFMK